MGWSSRLILLDADDSLHRLPSAAFSRMLKDASACRVIDFAGKRVRMVSVTAETAGGFTLGVRHMSFSILDFDPFGILDVQRLSTQQVARFDAMVAGKLGAPLPAEQVVDASSRFVARGGSWEPDAGLRRRIEAAVVGTARCPRVKLIG
jgi:hypothetical protein